MTEVIVPGDQRHIVIDAGLRNQGVSKLGLQAPLLEHPPNRTRALPIAALHGEKAYV